VPCLFQTGVDSFEPTMGMTRDGTVFTNGLQGNGAVIVRSSDRGASWRVVGGLAAGQSLHPLSDDPYLFVDRPTGRVFWTDYVWACSLLSYSDDRGESWTTTPLAGCGQADHQSVFAGPPRTSSPRGYPHVVYYCSEVTGQSVASPGSACQKSVDGGLTFVATGAPAYTDDLFAHEVGDYGARGVCGGFHGHGLVGRDGRVYLPRGWCGQPYLAISDDEGLTWRRVQVARNGMALSEYGQWSHEAGVGEGPDGTLYYVWTARDRLPYLAVSRDHGAHWSPPLMVAAPGVREATMPGIDVGTDGRVAIVYLGSTDSRGKPFIEREHCPMQLPACVLAAGHAAANDFGLPVVLDEQVASRYRSTTWNGYLAVSLAPSARDPLFASVSVNRVADPLARGLCGPDPDRCEIGDFFDVVVAPDGSVWASMVDACVSTCVRPRSEADKHGDATHGVVARLVGLPRPR
jgi:hypothetical protein